MLDLRGVIRISSEYERVRRWRRRRPEKHREQKRRYYAKTVNAPKRGGAWQDWEVDYLLSAEEADRAIAETLGRSMKAVQYRRYKELKAQRREET